MTRDAAHALLDAVRAGARDVPIEQITEALRVTGDIPAARQRIRAPSEQVLTCDDFEGVPA